MNESRKSPDFLWVQTALLILALVPVSLLAHYLDARTFNGINIWIKPIKFQVSAVVHLLTLYLVSQLMSDRARRAWLLRILVWASSLATMFEIFIITLRASQGSASHFNVSTPVDAILYGLMGIGALVMLTPAVYLAIRFTFNKTAFRGGAGLHFGIVMGFLSAAVLTVLFAGFMSSNGSHWTSGQVSDAGGLPLVGWSQRGGDLRPAHFFALHLMQFLPLMGLIMDRVTSLSATLKRSAIIVALLMIGGLSVFTFNQALAGKAFVKLKAPLPSSSLTAGETDFWQSLNALCGKRFEGKMTFPAEGQDSFAGKTLVAEFSSCGADRISVPFAVGEDQSRTWVFTKKATSIEMKHDHRHHGVVDDVSNYGGLSIDSSSAARASFPADAYTAQLIPAAATNVWSIIVGEDGRTLTYHLERHAAPRFTAELTLVE